jgi:hypothetical protein
MSDVDMTLYVLLVVEKSQTKSSTTPLTVFFYTSLITS